MKNKCLLVLLLALGCCHVQAQKSQKDPLSEALVRLNQKVDSELIPGIKRFPLIGISLEKTNGRHPKKLIAIQLPATQTIPSLAKKRRVEFLQK